MGKQRRGGQQINLEQQHSDELPGGSSDPGRDSQDAPHHLDRAPEQTNGPVSTPRSNPDAPDTVFAAGSSQEANPRMQVASTQHEAAGQEAEAKPGSQGLQMIPNGVLQDGPTSASHELLVSNQQPSSEPGVGVASNSGAQHEVASSAKDQADQNSSHAPAFLTDGPINGDGSAPTDPTQPAER